MARRPQDVTDAELDVLRTLWDDGEATIRARCTPRMPRPLRTRGDRP